MRYIVSVLAVAALMAAMLAAIASIGLAQDGGLYGPLIPRPEPPPAQFPGTGPAFDDPPLQATPQGPPPQIVPQPQFVPQQAPPPVPPKAPEALPSSGGLSGSAAALFALGTSVLLVGGGLVVRRIAR